MPHSRTYGGWTFALVPGVTAPSAATATGPSTPRPSGLVEPVRDAIPSLRYHPAVSRGRAVSQLVEQTFAFSLNR